VPTASVVAAPPSAPPPPAGPFDGNAARAALALAAAQANACKSADAPGGSGKVMVQFDNDGNTLSAMLAGPIGDTPLAGCILSAFRGARVPPFTGPRASVTRSLTIK
jgi:hypothetical protein